jgi:hypothetical protein
MQCGGPTEALNRLESGRRCPSCRDRHLAMVPPILPGYRLEELASEVDEGPLSEPEQGASQLRLCRPE